MKKNMIIILSIVLAVICFLLLIFMPKLLKNKKINPENIIDNLKDLKSYSTNMSIEIKNDKQKLKYDCKQMYKRGVGYRLEIDKNRVLVFKDDKIYVTDLENNCLYSTGKEFDEVYKIGFIGEYIKLLYTDEKINYSNKKENEKEYLLIDLIIPSNNKNIKRAVMWVEKKEKKPYKTIIYNEDSEETIEIKYNNFQKNIDVNNKLFNKTKEN